MGLQFYSRLPVAKGKHETPNLSNIALALPFTSFIIGVFPALILAIGVTIGLPPLFGASLAIATWVLITGAMAEDAIADSSDGLFGGQTKEKRLEILKDPRHGTYGVSALVIYIALRIFALAAIATHSALIAALVWIAATILARSSALWLTIKLPSARSSGASASIGQLKKSAFFIGMAFAILIAFVLSTPFVGLISFIATIAVIIIISFFWARLCQQKINGQTGDLIGGLQALLEVGIFTMFLIGLNL